MSKTVAVIEGDDAAPEAVRPTIELIQKMALPIDWVYPVVGAEAKLRDGTPFPQAARDMIDASDTTFFGSTSGSSGVALM